MSILIAPDSFKGTYTAAEVAAAVAAGVADAGGHAVQLPVADGGEGSFEALCRGLGARPVPVEVQNPWGSPARAEIGITADGGTASSNWPRPAESPWRTTATATPWPPAPTAPG